MIIYADRKYGKNIVCSVSVRSIALFSVALIVVFDFLLLVFCKFVCCMSRVTFSGNERTIQSASVMRYDICIDKHSFITICKQRVLEYFSLMKTRVWCTLDHYTLSLVISHSIDLHGHLQIHRYQ